MKGICFECAAHRRASRNKSQIEKEEKQMIEKIAKPPLFGVGQIVATPGALAALEKTGETATQFVARHATGGWGELPLEDRTENYLSVERGLRLLSSYLTSAGDRIWVITESDRSLTTILLPDEY
jgi:hypothetical protein